MKQILINKREGAGLKRCNHCKAFFEYPIDTDDIYEIIEEQNPSKEHKILIVFDDMIAGMLDNKTNSNSNTQTIWMIFTK